MKKIKSYPMKKLFIIILVTSTINFTLAQQHKKDFRAMDYTPEEIASLKTKKMTLFLDLNQAQQDAIYAINLENANRRKAHIAKRKAMKENDEKPKMTKEERLQKVNNRLDRKIALKEKMKSILTAEQYQKWENAMTKRKRHAKMKKKKHSSE